jgi:hypothetical protein
MCLVVKIKLVINEIVQIDVLNCFRYLVFDELTLIQFNDTKYPSLCVNWSLVDISSLNIFCMWREHAKDMQIARN